MESMGVASGYGCKEVYRFSHITYPYSSCICSFLQQHSYFLFIKKNIFRSCTGTFCNLCNNFFAQYKQTIRETMAVPRQPYEGIHIMFYT